MIEFNVIQKSGFKFNIIIASFCLNIVPPLLKTPDYCSSLLCFILTHLPAMWHIEVTADHYIVPYPGCVYFSVTNQ